jgi:hypothetical protein
VTFEDFLCTLAGFQKSGFSKRLGREAFNAGRDSMEQEKEKQIIQLRNMLLEIHKASSIDYQCSSCPIHRSIEPLDSCGDKDFCPDRLAEFYLRQLGER